MRRYVYRDKKEIHRLLHSYETSGLTIKSFCKQRKIALSTFTNWRKRKREIDGEINLPTVTPSSFMQVSLTEKPSETNKISVTAVHIRLDRSELVSVLRDLFHDSHL